MSRPLEEIYQRLLDHFGPQHWWPGDTPLEIMVGAVLTQNTNWENVEKAIANLRRAELLDLQRLAEIPTGMLAELIRPSGYYNLKAVRLHNLLRSITAEHPSLESFFAADRETLREQLLAVKGIGPETADSILLYAAGKPTFVIDAYTHRLLLRHGLIWEESDYYEMQELFLSSLPEDLALFNEYHALIVRVGKEFCRKTKPRCADCPLREMLPESRWVG
ncbi:MAG TPA: endonuclease III domain-containing protein [Desulfurivibrionaceae bacterium]|nr:endonuclease III domain-containing protein [Desulfurivibrionaceae bacterium]